MANRGRPRKKPELIEKPNPPEKQDPQELADFIQEANEVHQLTNMRGWQIIRRDLMSYRESIVSRLAYINPKRVEFNELRLLFLAADKLISMVEDYKVNRDKAKEYLDKLVNPEVAVPLDVDLE